MWDQNLVNDAWHEWVSGKPITFRSCWIGFGKYQDEKHDTCFSDCCRTEHPFGLRPGPAADEGTMGFEINRSLRPHYTTYTQTLNNGMHIHGFQARNTTITFNAIASCGIQSSAEHENQCCGTPAVKAQGVTCGMKFGFLSARGCWDPALTALLSTQKQKELEPFL
jgi:hypothetical protein